MDMRLGLTLVLLLSTVVASAEMEGKMPQLIQQVTTLKALNVAMYVDPLPQLSKIDAVAQPNLTIGMYMTNQKFHRDLANTTIFAYGTSAATATFPGPVIETTRFVPTYVTWENHLPLTHILPWDTSIAAALPARGGVPTVVHLHAGTVAPEDDGHALAWFTANYTEVGPTFTSKTYYYPNVQHSGNLVYHDHAVGLTRINLLAGLLGPYVIREPLLESYLNLPSGPDFDQHLVIADRSFNSDGSLYMNPVGGIPGLHPSWNPEYYGDANTVNGKVWPFLNVQRRKYRFRILNASNARYYWLYFISNETSAYTFTVVGSDSSYLSSPVTTDSITLAVAESFDIVFDFSTVAESEIELINIAPAPFPGGSPLPLTDPISRVMKFVINQTTVPDPSSVPGFLSNYPPAAENQTTVTRYLALYEYLDAGNNSMHLLINGKRFAEAATETSRNGSTELWNVINLTGDNHPLHIHLAHFQTIGFRPLVNVDAFKACMQSIHDPFLCDVQAQLGLSVSPPAYEKTWKNIAKLLPNYMTSVVVKFSMADTGAPFPFDPTAAPGYVYHCHILDHEDNEMIRPLLITP